MAATEPATISQTNASSTRVDARRRRARAIVAFSETVLAYAGDRSPIGKTLPAGALGLVPVSDDHDGGDAYGDGAQRDEAGRAGQEAGSCPRRAADARATGGGYAREAFQAPRGTRGAGPGENAHPAPR